MALFTYVPDEMQEMKKISVTGVKTCIKCIYSLIIQKATQINMSSTGFLTVLVWLYSIWIIYCITFQTFYLIKDA